MEAQVGTKTPPPSSPGPPPPADNVFGRTWSRAWAYTRANPMLAGFIVVGLIARIAFWAITDRKLDDALITIKFDKNLADGFGLVHNLGEGHVQGFTSALSVLVPLPGELIYHGGGFLFIRLASLAFFVIAAVYAYRIAAELGVGRWPTALVLAYLALDQNQVFFGMAGMETQIAVGVLLASAYYVLVEDYPKSGVTLGLALLARPDFVLWIGPAYLFLIIRNWRASLRAAALSAAVVAPWLIFTTIYYGSPIPNTITAKDNAFVPDFPSVTHPGAWINFLGDQLSANAHAWQHLRPLLRSDFHRPLSDSLRGRQGRSRASGRTGDHRCRRNLQAMELAAGDRFPPPLGGQQDHLPEPGVLRVVRATRAGDADPDGRGGARPGFQMDGGSDPRAAHTRGRSSGSGRPARAHLRGGASLPHGCRIKDPARHRGQGACQGG